MVLNWARFQQIDLPGMMAMAQQYNLNIGVEELLYRTIHNAQVAVCNVQDGSCWISQGANQYLLSMPNNNYLVQLATVTYQNSQDGAPGNTQFTLEFDSKGYVTHGFSNDFLGASGNHNLPDAALFRGIFNNNQLVGLVMYEADWTSPFYGCTGPVNQTSYSDQVQYGNTVTGYRALNNVSSYTNFGIFASFSSIPPYYQSYYDFLTTGSSYLARVCAGTIQATGFIADLGFGSPTSSTCVAFTNQFCGSQNNISSDTGCQAYCSLNSTDCTTILHTFCNTGSNMTNYQNDICACFQTPEYYSNYLKEWNDALGLTSSDSQYSAFTGTPQCYWANCSNNLAEYAKVQSLKTGNTCPSITACLNSINANFVNDPNITVSITQNIASCLNANGFSYQGNIVNTPGITTVSPSPGVTTTPAITPQSLTPLYTYLAAFLALLFLFFIVL